MDHSLEGRVRLRGPAETNGSTFREREDGHRETMTLRTFSLSADGIRVGSGQVNRLRQIWAPAALVAVLLGLFFPLLVHPERFPTTASAVEARHLLATARLTHEYRDTGVVALAESLGPAENLAAVPGYLLTHPVYFTIQHLAPPALAVGLTILFHLTVGSIAMFFLLRATAVRTASALFAALVFALTGGLLSRASTAPDDLGLVFAAALFPALVLSAWRALESPSAARGVLVAIVVGLQSSSGDVRGLVLALALGSLAMPVFWFLRPPSPATVRRRAGILGGAVVLGVSLGCFRWLPTLAASGDGEGFRLMRDLIDLPWWRDARNGLTLPYHLGVITLIAALLGARNLAFRRDGSRLLVLLVAPGFLLAAFGPLAALPFLGFFFGLAASAAFSGLHSPARRAWLREPAALAATALLVVGALPYYAPLVRGQTVDEMVETPLWVIPLAERSVEGRIAVVDADPQEYAPALAARGLRYFPGARHWKTVDAFAMGELTLNDIQYIVADQPDRRGRLRLLEIPRAAGKYIYVNPQWTGPVAGVGEITAGERPAFVPVYNGAADSRATDWERSADRLSCRVDLPRPALLSVSETPLDGSRVSVDGRDTMFFRSDGSRVLVPCPAGTHRIELGFVPPGWELGRTVSALALTALPFILFIPWMRRRVRQSNRRPDFRAARAGSPETARRSRRALAMKG